MEGGTGRFVRSIKRDRDRLRKGEEGGKGNFASRYPPRDFCSCKSRMKSKEGSVLKDR